MLRRLDGDEGRTHAPQTYAGATPPEQAVAPIDESNQESSLLPRDHPKWARDFLGSPRTHRLHRPESRLD